MTTAPPRPRARVAARPAPPHRRPTAARRGAVSASRRIRVGRVLLVVVLGIATLKLVVVQALQAPDLNAASARQLLTEIPLPAERGAILDSAGKPLAFSTEANALVTNPRTIARTHGASTADYVARMANVVGQATGQDPAALQTLLTSDKGYVVLAKLVDPSLAAQMHDQFPEIALERREAREYPGGSLAANVIGAATWDATDTPGKLTGRIGLESSQDNLLSGSNGVREVDTAEGSNAEIPGSVRYERPAVPGSTLQLTVDSDLQYTVQRDLSAFIAKTRAKGDSSAVVLDVATGKVRALATGETFDPTNPGAASSDALGDPAVTSPFEPGSVNKIVTMSAAIEYGVAKPDDVLNVPGSIKVADRTINDAWVHGLAHYTLTGVLAKSSNVGTIMTAQKVGPDRFADMLARYGLGVKTGVGLPGESGGSVPPMATWSGSTFGNLPIGQGLSMTVLQMAGMYQAVANNGMRIPPRIVEATTGPDGVRTEIPTPAGVQVVSPQTAATLRTMLTAVTQDVHRQRGTGPTAAVPGYQVAGKTGTAQQVNPVCGCYSSSTYWITFAGMFPAQNPRFVVGIMLDAPAGGASAAPLFHDIATYLAQRDHIPLTTNPTPPQTLQLP
jgi:cell division protein FtsI (penicillin-binding protein 3)